MLPGQAGTSVVFGRGVTFGGPFRHLASFTKGDSITVTTGQGKATYVVDDVRIAGDPFPAALASGASRLVLESSVGGGYRSEWAPTQSIYVDADLANPFPSGQVGPTLQSQRALRPTGQRCCPWCCGCSSSSLLTLDSCGRDRAGESPRPGWSARRFSLHWHG